VEVSPPPPFRGMWGFHKKLFGKYCISIFGDIGLLHCSVATWESVLGVHFILVTYDMRFSWLRVCTLFGNRQKSSSLIHAFYTLLLSHVIYL
jgi:hypothetical protein